MLILIHFLALETGLQFSCEWLVNWILQRNKSKVSLARETLGKGCFWYPRPYKPAPKGVIILFYFHIPSSSVDKSFERAMKLLFLHFISSVRW